MLLLLLLTLLYWSLAIKHSTTDFHCFVIFHTAYIYPMLLPLFLYTMLIPYNTTHKRESRFKESETKSSSGKVNSVTDICMQLSHWQPNSPPSSSATLLYIHSLHFRSLVVSYLNTKVVSLMCTVYDFASNNIIPMSGIWTNSILYVFMQLCRSFMWLVEGIGLLLQCSKQGEYLFGNFDFSC